LDVCGTGMMVLIGNSLSLCFTDEWWDVLNGPAYDMQPHSEGDKKAARDVSTTCMYSGTFKMESGTEDIIKHIFMNTVLNS